MSPDFMNLLKSSRVHTTAQHIMDPPGRRIDPELILLHQYVRMVPRHIQLQQSTDPRQELPTLPFSPDPSSTQAAGGTRDCGRMTLIRTAPWTIPLIWKLSG